MSDASHEVPPGSATEEAARLADAATRWLNTHVATGGETCQVCPLCQLIEVVRERQPDVAEHLGRAAEALIAAARAALVHAEATWASDSRPVQHIDIE